MRLYYLSIFFCTANVKRLYLTVHNCNIKKNIYNSNIKFILRITLVKNIEITYLKKTLFFSALWFFYLWSAFYLSDNNSSLLGIWGIINWGVFLIIPFLNHKYLIQKQKKFSNIINWVLAVLYLAYLYPIFNGFIGDKIVIQPAYIVSLYCIIRALKNIFIAPKVVSENFFSKSSDIKFEKEEPSMVIKKQITDKEI